MAILLDEEESVVKIAGSGGKWNYGATQVGIVYLPKLEKGELFTVYLGILVNPDI